ncbi:MAG: hypothetical protein HGB12_16770, partial [Bacteroidetes bacterium]|nr:hypothetical protein [Bacteroidota bacterium]
QITDNATWAADATGAYSCFNNDCTTNGATYGMLYNLNAVTNANGICPTGWHVPTDAEWCTLENTVEAGTDPACNRAAWGGDKTGMRLREAGTTHWYSDNTCDGVCNESGFTALGASFRYGNTGDFCNALTVVTAFWSTTNIRRYIDHSTKMILRDADNPAAGNSVRCVKD